MNLFHDAVIAPVEFINMHQHAAQQHIITATHHHNHHSQSCIRSMNPETKLKIKGCQVNKRSVAFLYPALSPVEPCLHVFNEPAGCEQE